MNQWVSVKEKLPEHLAMILAYSAKWHCVCIFLDSIEANKMLVAKGCPEEQVDPQKTPYYFFSQEVIANALQGVTHWMPLPAPPK